MTKELDTYFKLEEDIQNYFGYVEDWQKFPLDDCRESFWYLAFNDEVRFADSEEELINETGNYYECEVYSQRSDPKGGVYRGTDYTMICVDTHCDGNKFLSIFSNEKERPQNDIT